MYDQGYGRVGISTQWVSVTRTGYLSGIVSDTKYLAVAHLLMLDEVLGQEEDKVVFNKIIALIFGS